MGCVSQGECRYRAEDPAPYACNQQKCARFNLSRALGKCNASNFLDTTKCLPSMTDPSLRLPMTSSTNERIIGIGPRRIKTVLPDDSARWVCVLSFAAPKESTNEKTKRPDEKLLRKPALISRRIRNSASYVPLTIRSFGSPSQRLRVPVLDCARTDNPSEQDCTVSPRAGVSRPMGRFWNDPHFNSVPPRTVRNIIASTPHGSLLHRKTPGRRAEPSHYTACS